MSAILKKCKKEEGAASVIEMTLIFPLVLMVMGFLIYTSSYVLQSVTMYNDAQRVAMAAAKEGAIPGYENLYKGMGITTRADFSYPEGSAPSAEIINNLMKVHKPYRFFGNSFLNDAKSSLEANMKRLVNNHSFLSSTNVTCEITTSNSFLNQQVKVRVKKYISTPGFVRSIGMKDSLTMEVVATAVVGSPTEFIRNTDMLFDLKDYLFENLKIGGSTINEKIAVYKQKFSDMAAKIGLGW